MSVKILIKIDRFYWLLIGVLGLLLFLVVMTYKEIFQSLTAINKPPERPLSIPLIINKDNLIKAYEWIFNKKIISLDTGE